MLCAENARTIRKELEGIRTLVDIFTGIFALILTPIIFLTSFLTCKKYWIPNAKMLNECRGPENQLPTGYWVVWAKNIKEIFLELSLRDL